MNEGTRGKKSPSWNCKGGEPYISSLACAAFAAEPRVRSLGKKRKREKELQRKRSINDVFLNRGKSGPHMRSRRQLQAKQGGRQKKEESINHRN